MSVRLISDKILIIPHWLGSTMSLTLYYFHAPLCSWCWAFRPRWQEIVAGLPNFVRSHRVLGGLAPDTDQTMTTAMQLKLRAI